MVRSAVSGSQDGDCVYKHWSTEADLSRQSRRSRREGSCCSRPCNVHEAAAGWRPRDRRSLRGLLATSIPDSGRTPATAISLRSSNVMRFLPMFCAGRSARARPSTGCVGHARTACQPGVREAECSAPPSATCQILLHTPFSLFSPPELLRIC